MKTPPPRTQRPILHDIKNNFTSTKINVIDVHAEFALEWQSSIGVNTLT